MFESIEAIKGPFDRSQTLGPNKGKILKSNGVACGFSKADVGVKIVCIGFNHVLVGFEAGSGREMRVQNVNRGFI